MVQLLFPVLEQTPNMTTPGYKSSNEMDSHADTCCLDSNRQILYLTNDIVDMTSFSYQYDVMCDMPICGGTTYVQLPSGDEFVLEIHLVLWFGNQLPASMLNSNQLRAYNMQVGDSLFDANNPICAF